MQCYDLLSLFPLKQCVGFFFFFFFLSLFVYRYLEHQMKIRGLESTLYPISNQVG